MVMIIYTATRWTPLSQFDSPPAATLSAIRKNHLFGDSYKTPYKVSTRVIYLQLSTNVTWSNIKIF